MGDIHHVIPKFKDGDNRSSNLMMLHINCHKQIHNPRSKYRTCSTDISLKGLSYMMSKHLMRFLVDRDVETLLCYHTNQFIDSRNINVQKA
ncbi:HNH endonuclease signature motif containing protein [Orientia tsutsugamushi]|uniref:HNH endonuclease signature motif containing protein n=1 Tax=Orientia tsutsugamushi TaxID=784 RepID=UPI0011BA8A78